MLLWTGAYVATAAGWQSFGQWADKLPVDKYDEIVRLWEHGWSQQPALLARQITAALSAQVPTEGTREVARALARYASQARHNIIVSEGS